MIRRFSLLTLKALLQENPAVVLLGPRQSGKTTLALELAHELGLQGGQALYLDLESERDLAKLGQAESYLERHSGKLVILDEVQRMPGLFPSLRGLIDQARRQGRKTGQYLLLGSASLDLLKQAGESLAGRIALHELTPFTVGEIAAADGETLWLRGGFPESFLATDDRLSLRWRENFIRTYLERDIPFFVPRLAAETLRRFWTMLAHLQGTLLNVAQLARNLGVDTKTAGSYLNLMVDLLLARRLPPWHAKLGKRLVKAPKVYLRDSGLLHALLGIGDIETLLSHPVIGNSFEGFVIENLISSAPRNVQPYFYRTSGGAEIDLLLVWPSGKRWAVEVKRSSAPKAGRGFHAACRDLAPERRFIVYPGNERFPVGDGVEAIPHASLVEELNKA